MFKLPMACEHSLTNLCYSVNCTFIHKQSNVSTHYFLVFTVPPTITSTLPTTKQTKKENETMSYACTAEAKPAAKILWVLNGQNLTHIPPYNITGSFQVIPNFKLLRTFSYLTINQLSWRHYGNFSCVAYNDAGQVRQNTELEVQCKYSSCRCRC